MLDALILFEDDPRLNDHVNCWADLFVTSRSDILKDFHSLKELKVVEKNFISRYGKKVNGTVSEPSRASDLPKIYGQRILAQGQCLKFPGRAVKFEKEFIWPEETLVNS